MLLKSSLRTLSYNNNRQIFDENKIFPPKITKFRDRQSSVIEIRFATTDSLREDSYRIRYAGYRSRGHILEKDTPLWSDEFDDIHSTKIIVLFKYGMPVATARLCFFDSSFIEDISEALPSANQFNYSKKDIQKKLCLPHDRLKIIEISKLSSLPEQQDQGTVLISIYEFIRDTIFNLGADIVIISVRLRHVNFYARFGFKILENGKFYKNDNVVLSLLACSAGNFRSLAKRRESEFHNIQKI